MRYHLTAWLMLCAYSVNAQVNPDSLALRDHFAKGQFLLSQQSYDSAIHHFNRALAVASEKNLLDYYTATRAMMSIGECHWMKGDHKAAHDNYYKALLNARSYSHHSSLRASTLLTLNRIHAWIQSHNINFPYPQAKNLVEEKVFFGVDSVVRETADSMIILINAGSYDGIPEPALRNEVEIYSLFQFGKEKSGDFLFLGRLLRVTANETLVSLPKKGVPGTAKGLQVLLRVNVPALLLDSPLKEAFLQNYNWRSNENNRDLFNRRFFYHYFDARLFDDLSEILKEEIKTVVDRYAPDTLNAESKLSQPIGSGMYRGINVMRAISQADRSSFLYFFHFMDRYANSYRGNDFRFSEIYASWVLNGAGLNSEDARAYILGDEKRSADLILRAQKILPQAEEENFVSTWVDQALDLVDKNHLGKLLSQCRLLHHYGRASARPELNGWAYFFDALRFKGFGQMDHCDSVLQLSMAKFREAGNAEGLKWIESAKATVLDTSGIKFNVQRTHFLGYKAFPSPNGRYFATASNDYTIGIWDVQLGKQVRTLVGHTDAVTYLAYNPGGRYLASLSLDSSIRVWSTFSYSPMMVFKPSSPQLQIQFTPDGKYLVGCGSDSVIRFWDPFSGKLEKAVPAPGYYSKEISFSSANKDLMFLLGADSAVHSYDLKNGKLDRVLKINKNISYFRLSKNGRFAAYTSIDSTVNVLDMNTGFSCHRGKIYLDQSGGQSLISEGSFSPDSRFFIYCSGDSNLVVVDLQSSRAVSLYGGISHQLLFSKTGDYYIGHSGGNPWIVDFTAFDFSKTYDAIYAPDLPFEQWNEYYMSLRQREFYNEMGPVMEPRFSADGNSIWFVCWGTQRVDLKSGRSELVNPDHHWMSGEHKWPVNEELVVYRNFKVDDTLKVMNRKTNSLIANLYFSGKEEIESFAFYANDTRCIIGGQEGSLAAWDLVSKKMVYEHLNIAGEKGITSLLRRPHSDTILAFNSSMKPLVLDARGGTHLGRIGLPGPERGVAGSRLYYFALGDSVYSVDAGTLVPKSISSLTGLNGPVEDLILSSNEKILIVLDEPFYYVLDATTLEMLHKIRVDVNNLERLDLSPNDSLLAIGSLNGSLVLLKPFSGEKLATIYFPTLSDCIIFDKEGHYLASKRSLESVVFNLGQRSFNYDQFDLILNRPHKVLQNIGLADKSTINAYETAYRRRMLKNEGSATSISISNMPSVILLDDIKGNAVTSAEKFGVGIQFFDFKHKLKSIRITVNNIPLQDPEVPWDNLDTTSLVLDLDIPLTPGLNRVKIHCVNQLGFNSFKETIEIYCTAKPKGSRTWFIGLGTSEYADKNQNLVYSAKDVRDLATAFKKLDPNIIIDTLLNSNVTLKNISSLKERMKKIGLTDKVIFVVTGHGLLSDSLDFYYATHDVDFNRPEQKGLRYEEMESMLNQTAARQKLLLIDACHSGLVDKETISKAEFFSDSTNGVRVKGAKGLIRPRSGAADASSSFNLMNALFADFSDNNGIVVISAAGGLEVALESSEWKNGVFTYSILKALENNEADNRKYGGNEDYKVSVQELMRYVNRKVPELTRGLQQPTSRRENLEFDWYFK